MRKLSARGRGPHGVFWVRGIAREVPKGLTVVEPRLLDLLGGVGVIHRGVTVRLVQEFVTFAAKNGGNF